MCGINGIISFSGIGRDTLSKVSTMNASLRYRGPDFDGVFKDDDLALGHRRLSIIDTSNAGNQPMTDTTGRYVIVFNGEFFNYKQHRDHLLRNGHEFKTASDTEVLMKLYSLEGPSFLRHVNGFFALAIYDQIEKSLFIARDRFGIKPLLIYEDEERLVFSSEMKGLMQAGIKKDLDITSLLNFLHLNYIPGNWTIFNGVKRMEPGTWMIRKPGDRDFIQQGKYYEMPDPAPPYFNGSFEAAKDNLKTLLRESVELRMISDVPLGAFLSGGIDSSVIVALASGYTSKLNTFSIGFKDEPHYDETAYARMVADKYKTEHTEFSLTTTDLFEELYRVLDYLDEPFADSSALAVQILCHRTSKHVKVALSGDGADELFGGYNKHRAELWFKSRPYLTSDLRKTSPAHSVFNGIRSSSIGNLIRKIHRFAEGASMDSVNRYWRWCGHISEREAFGMLVDKSHNRDFEYRKSNLLQYLGDGSKMEQIFRSDMSLVLPGDMLVKVDMMSMANSLEVRVPFLDYRVVDFALKLPASYRISASQGKLVLREAFREMLPAELFNRPKHGFEVPLLKWFRTELRGLIENDLLSDEFVISQGIFEPDRISELRQRLFSANPGDIEARIWGLIVFQYWWKNNMIND
ncbi:MAG: asparagine synthase (glutamine-hydrolyzing) [Bacteroidota bacterium]